MSLSRSLDQFGPATVLPTLPSAMLAELEQRERRVRRVCVWGTYMRPEAKDRRQYWVAELAKLSGSFGDDADKMIEEVRVDIERNGPEALLDHLRLCGAMPKQYGHDSSEEKLYSKYTDALVSEALNAIG